MALCRISTVGFKYLQSSVIALSSPDCIDRNEINIKLEELKNTKRVLDDKAKQLFEVCIEHIS